MSVSASLPPQLPPSLEAAADVYVRTERQPRDPADGVSDVSAGTASPPPKQLSSPVDVGNSKVPANLESDDSFMTDSENADDHLDDSDAGSETQSEQSASETYVLDIGDPILRDDDWDGVRVSRQDIEITYDSDTCTDNDLDSSFCNVDPFLGLGTSEKSSTKLCEADSDDDSDIFRDYDKPNAWGNAADRELDLLDDVEDSPTSDKLSDEGSQSCDSDFGDGPYHPVHEIAHDSQTEQPPKYDFTLPANSYILPEDDSDSSDQLDHTSSHVVSSNPNSGNTGQCNIFVDDIDDEFDLEEALEKEGLGHRATLTSAVGTNELEESKDIGNLDDDMDDLTLQTPKELPASAIDGIPSQKLEPCSIPSLNHNSSSSPLDESEVQPSQIPSDISPQENNHETRAPPVSSSCVPFAHRHCSTDLVDIPISPPGSHALQAACHEDVSNVETSEVQVSDNHTSSLCVHRPRIEKQVCSRCDKLRERLENVTAGLGAIQVLTAAAAANAAEADHDRERTNVSSTEAKMLSEILVLRTTVDRLTRLVLERAYRARDSEPR